MTSLNLLRAELIQHLAAVERKIEEVLEDETDARFLGTSGRVYKLSLLAAEARRVQAHLDYLEGQEERAA